jgi:GntR family transcriptional regulator
MYQDVIATLRKSVVLDQQAEESLWRQIVRHIEPLILDGVLPAGMKLPAVTDLAASLGVSRITVQTSYMEMARRGLILSQKGRGGTIVTGPGQRVASSMTSRLHGFTEEMRAIGREVSTRVVERDVVQDRQVATIMSLPSGTSLLRVKRIRLADGTPMSNELAWYNLREAPFLADADVAQSIYGLLARHGQALAWCEQTIEGVIARDEDRKIFGFSEPAACVLIKRSSFNAKKDMLEYVEGTFRGDAYSFKMTLRP